jgi:hypothetical protein
LDVARFLLRVMFDAARDRNGTVSLIRFAGDAAATDAGVEVEHATRPSRDLAVAWVERAQRLGTTEKARYAVRFFEDGKSTGMYALPAVTRMPATTPDEVAHEAAESETKKVRDQLRTAASLGCRLGQALARGKP